MAILQNLVDEAVTTAIEKFAPINLRVEELVVTLVDLRDVKTKPFIWH